jgi:hypothetical protein
MNRVTSTSFRALVLSLLFAVLTGCNSNNGGSFPSAQTITFANPGAQTVGMPLTLVATASSGLTVSFASTTTTVCTVSGASAAFIAAGSCSITATQAGNSTYAAATAVSLSFTVNAANPAAPTGLSAMAGNATVALSWSASSGATSYNVYRGTTPGGESATALATGITTTTYTDSTAVNNTTYYYKVAAVNEAGTSPMSNEASATPQLAKPTISSFTANPASIASGSSSTLSWATTGATSLSPLRRERSHPHRQAVRRA